MPKIDSLVPDIYRLFGPDGVVFTEEEGAAFGRALANRITSKMEDNRVRNNLSISMLGKPCDRELWYSINAPEKGEPLPPQARIKFLFGDILEEMLLFLAKKAGHKVENEQERVEIEGVKGHIDAEVDGEVVDVKSASSNSFQKFKAHTLEVPGNDAFGYLGQVNAYATAKGKSQFHFLAIDKQLGHIALDTYKTRKLNYPKLVKDKQEMLSWPQPPERGYKDKEGAWGNRELDVKCGYCAFKHGCWPGLRTAIMSGGPRYLTHVNKWPTNKNGPVPEV